MLNMDARTLKNIQDEDRNDNLRTREFYYRNLPFLMQVPLHRIRPDILQRISTGVHSRVLFDSDWREYVFTLGNVDNYILDSIQVSAKVSNESPIYVALSRGPLSYQITYGNVIETLLTKERMDILTDLKNFTSGLLKELSATQVKRLTSAEEQKFPTTNESDSTTETLGDLNRLSINADSSEKDISIACDIPNSEHSKCELSNLQNSVNVDCSAVVKIQPTSKTKEHSIDGVNDYPSAPSVELLSVFIQHTESESSIAEQLSTMLKDEGINVKSLSDMDYLLMMDSIGALTTILQGVDFIVPIVSEKFLEQIHPHVNMHYLESLDAVNNRSLYQLLMNEYRTNRCVNFRVRPVLVPGFNRNILKYDIILSPSLRLWNEVPKLIKILKKTKELIPNNVLR